MPTEFERSYIFTHESAHAFLKSVGEDFDLQHNEFIEDFYINRGLRIRKCGYPCSSSLYNWKYIIVQKTGEKSSGQREEYEEYISERVAKMLIGDPVLKVRKHRKTLSPDKMNFTDSVASNFTVTIDFVQEPMQVAILEIESKKYPLEPNASQSFFGKKLIECPLDAVSYFNRRIGICGGPSSGKSSVAQHLSHKLNTVFQSNSSHVAEFATTFIQKYRQVPDFWKQFFIWYGQRERERNADLANIVISDCPTFLSYIYLLLSSKQEFCFDTSLMCSKMYKRVLSDVNWYSDLIFLKLREYKENGVRYQNKEEALEIESRIQSFLDDHCIKYQTYDYTQADEILTNLFYINQ